MYRKAQEVTKKSPLPLKKMEENPPSVSIYHNTPQSFYNTVHYSTVLDITQFKNGPQKCIDYIEE